MELALIAFAALCASALTLVSGFGLSTVLVPIFALAFPIELAISAVALVHLINSLFKVVLLRHAIEWSAALRFGLPAAVAAVVGASLLGAIGGLTPVTSYALGGTIYQVTPVKLIVGGVILGLVALEISPFATQLRVSARAIPIGGLLSGFFGGLTGSQGVMRSAFLRRLNLTPERFAATGAVGAAIIDLSRLAVYGGASSSAALREDGPLRDALIVATLGALLGALVGRRVIRTITHGALRMFLAAAMALIATLMIGGII